MIPSSSSFRSNTPNPSSDPTGPSIRPRNRRLNTVESHEQELTTTSGTSSPAIASRAVSPIPAKHPSRSGGSGRLGNGRPVRGSPAPIAVSKNIGSNGSGSASPIAGMWNTGWMSGALQKVASSVLGSMAGEDEASNNIYPSGDARGKARRRAASGPSSRRALPEEWGPSQPTSKARVDGGIGSGSTTEREAAARARKMKGVLEGRNEEDSALDDTGRYKRRTSGDHLRPSGAKDDVDALAYIHHVQRHDTFAGVVLKYNCQKEVFRKANGLWSNDSIQFRKTVVLPVDACAVKGRPCEPPSTDPTHQGVDLLAPTPAEEEPPLAPKPGEWPSSSQSPYGSSAEPPEDEEKPWTHVRWVLIDSSPSSKPVEIARMSRKSLGYFPPRRRKSLVANPAVSSPRGSADLSSLSRSMSQLSHDRSSSTASTPPRRPSNLGPQPSPGSYFPPTTPRIRSHSRRQSVSEAADRYGWMQGPGGVGTLGKNVRKPGPGQDGLNAWTRKHIPGLTLDSLPSTSILGAESAHFGFGEELSAIAEGPFNGGSAVDGSATPSASQGRGLENAAAAVEGFFRKLVVKGPGTPKLGANIENDLIELLDGAGSDDGRGFELSPGRSRNATPVGTGREDLDGVIRGRTAAGAKGGKSD